MPAIEHRPPPDGTYRFVLYRDDLAPLRSQSFNSYSEVAKSRAVEWNGKVRQMLFIRSMNAFIRAKKLGWKDVTQKWFAESYSEPPPPPSPVFTDDALRLLAALRIEPKARKQLLQETGVNAAVFSKAIKILVEKGRAVRVGTGRDTKYRS